MDTTKYKFMLFFVNPNYVPFRWRRHWRWGSYWWWRCWWCCGKMSVEQDITDRGNDGKFFARAISVKIVRVNGPNHGAAKIQVFQILRFRCYTKFVVITKPSFIVIGIWSKYIILLMTLFINVIALIIKGKRLSNYAFRELGKVYFWRVPKRKKVLR